MQHLVTQLFAEAAKLVTLTHYKELRITQAAVFILTSPDYHGDRAKFAPLVEHYNTKIYTTSKDFYHVDNLSALQSMLDAFDVSWAT